MRKKNPFCSKCGVVPKTSAKRYCKKCAAEYMADWRKRHKTVPIENKTRPPEMSAE